MSLVEKVVNWLKKPTIEEDYQTLAGLEERLFYQAEQKAWREKEMLPQQRGMFRFETDRFGGSREYLTFSKEITKEGNLKTVLQIERPADFSYGVKSYRVVFYLEEPTAYFWKLDRSRRVDSGILYGNWQEVEDEKGRFFIVNEFLKTLALAYPQQTPMKNERMFSFDQN